MQGAQSKKSFHRNSLLPNVPLLSHQIPYPLPPTSPISVCPYLEACFRRLFPTLFSTANLPQSRTRHTPHRAPARERRAPGPVAGAHRCGYLQFTPTPCQSCPPALPVPFARTEGTPNSASRRRVRNVPEQGDVTGVARTYFMRDYWLCTGASAHRTTVHRAKPANRIFRFCVSGLCYLCSLRLKRRCRTIDKLPF